MQHIGGNRVWICRPENQSFERVGVKDGSNGNGAWPPDSGPVCKSGQKQGNDEQHREAQPDLLAERVEKIQTK
ncbi:protein of unknown function [Ruminococcaceae bacterium BL-6]|nr:protein of unknown function [Ruminococcaceae bacterium BL-6]